jgi:tRNA pseudouridine38-40 synthase
MRVALGVEYDGSAFCGWQTQPSGCGIEDALERAIAEVGGARADVVAAGRTDTGVHAIEQVVHFDAPVARPMTAWVRGVNAWLPGGVAVVWACPVDPAFHARRSALGRCYRYVLLNHPVRPALLRGKVGWYHRPLDADRMDRAAQALIGEHDFTAFRAAQCQAPSPVRILRRACVVRRGDYLVFEFEANGFLHHMVRNLVGSLVFVGEGKRAEPWIAELLSGRDRTVAAPTFEASGLYFVRASYGEQWRLPQRAAIDFIHRPGADGVPARTDTDGP